MLVRRFIAIATIGLALFVPTVAAHADSVKIPFTDRNVVGSLTFCDKSNKEVTSGSITDIPFVWKYVSSAPAPKGYYGPLGKADALVLQPREGVDPGLWNGKQMTGSAHYSNPQHPAVQATYGDLPLIDFTSIAPLWQGLAQVRVYYSNVNMQPYRTTYPAAIIKVSGTKWTLVQGGGGNCAAATAVSNESSLLGPSHLPSASPTFNPANPSVTPSAIIIGAPSQSSTDQLGASAAAGGTGSGPSPAASDLGGANLASSSSSSPTTSWPLLIAAVIGLPLIGGLIGAFLVRRKVSVAGAGNQSGSGS
jgi:hypothetical protein